MEEADPSLEGEGLGHLLAHHRVHVGAEHGQGEVDPGHEGHGEAHLAALLHGAVLRPEEEVVEGAAHEERLELAHGGNCSTAAPPPQRSGARASQGGGRWREARSTREYQSSRPGRGSATRARRRWSQSRLGGSHSSHGSRPGALVQQHLAQPPRVARGHRRDAQRGHQPPAEGDGEHVVVEHRLRLAVHPEAARASPRAAGGEATVSNVPPSALTSTSMLRSSRGPSSAERSVTPVRRRGCGRRQHEGPRGVGGSTKVRRSPSPAAPAPGQLETSGE